MHELSSGLHLWHGCAPEVIEEEVLQRRCGTKVFVIQDGRDIIEHETTEQAVPVTSHHQSSEKTDLLPRHYSHRWRETSLSTAKTEETTDIPGIWPTSQRSSVLKFSQSFTLLSAEFMSLLRLVFVRQTLDCNGHNTCRISKCFHTFTILCFFLTHLIPM